MRNPVWLCGLVLALGCSASGIDIEREPVEPLEAAGQFLVLGVVNVDTLAVDLDGDGDWTPEEETVRLLGIQGPNYDQSAGVMEFPSREAVAFLQASLEGQYVSLGDDRREEGLYRQDPPPEFAVTEDYRLLRDGGPWLAYCYVGDVRVNRELLERGYAWVREDVPCNRLADLRAAEQRAKRKTIGVWQFRK